MELTARGMQLREPCSELSHTVPHRRIGGGRGLRLAPRKSLSPTACNTTADFVAFIRSILASPEARARARSIERENHNLRGYGPGHRQRDGYNGPGQPDNYRVARSVIRLLCRKPIEDCLDRHEHERVLIKRRNIVEHDAEVEANRIACASRGTTPGFELGLDPNGFESDIPTSGERELRHGKKRGLYKKTFHHKFAKVHGFAKGQGMF